MADSVTMIAGQSNGVQMCSVPVAGCNPISGTYVWQPNTAWRAMTSSDGAGMIEIANAQRARGYDNVYAYNCSHGGSSVVPNATDPTHPHNCWQSQASDSPLTDCLAQVSAGAKKPQVVIWVQGEQEALYSRLHPTFDMVTNYRTCLGQLHDFTLGQWGLSAAQCAWIVTPVGYVSYGDPQYACQAQQQYAASTAGVFLGPSREDLALLNEGGVLVHLTGPSCLTFGDRIAQCIREIEMTDPQDKAAIASLQAAVSGLQGSIATLQIGVNSLLASAASLQSNVLKLQQNVGSLQHRTSALEADDPNLVKWPMTWPQQWH